MKIGLPDDRSRWVDDDCLTLAEHARHYDDMVPHYLTLLRLAARADTVLELGVRGGVSTWAILDGLASAGTLVSVDIEDCRDILPDRVLNDPRWTFVIGSDLLVPLDWAELVFIDTDHEYRHTLAELDLAARLHARIIALHDYALPDVSDAVDGFVKRNPEWSCRVEESQWGLAVLER